MRRLEGAEDVLARADARINEPAGAKLVECDKVIFPSFTLRVRTEGATAVRAFLPVETEPGEVFKHRRNELRFAAGAIEVFVS